MSGHSKWSTIKHKKAATDQKRGKLFSKLSRAIIVSAREGGADPLMNSALATAVQKAKDYSMPKDNIERAIQRGAGGGDQDAYETVVYEGYGPGGAAFLVEALTDNRNRTAANVRGAFNKGGGSLGTPGSVAYQFDRKGVVVVGDGDEDDLMLVALDAGADDVVAEDELFRVTCEPAMLNSVRTAVAGAGFAVESAEISMVPQTLNTVDDDTARRLLRLVDLLEDDDDVQEVFFNFDVPESVLAE